jgi:rhodanese-related sulfurtransferase
VGEERPRQEGERLDTDRARELVASGEVTVVDIRDPDAFAKEHIAGARPATDTDAASLAGELEGQKVLVVCEDGEQSARFADELRGHGVEANSLDGGIEEWAGDRLPMQPSSDPGQEPSGPPKVPGAGSTS